jgi:catechol 2,3-dioxygenase-like lactoylglutathione lyase family enzyme
MNSYSYGAPSPQEVRGLLGPVRQVGYIVDDVEASALDWANRLGIGPWRLQPNVVFETCRYRGRVIDVDIAMATAMSNGLEIELIAPNEGPASMYSDFLASNGPGAQHVCHYPTDYTAAHAHLTGSGLSVVLDGSIHGVRFAYMEDGRGHLIEIADLPDAALESRAARAAAATTWDGSDPIGG